MRLTGLKDAFHCLKVVVVLAGEFPRETTFEKNAKSRCAQTYKYKHKKKKKK